VVPVLRNVETMSFADIEKELNSLAAKVYIMGSSYMRSSVTHCCVSF